MTKNEILHVDELHLQGLSPLEKIGFLRLWICRLENATKGSVSDSELAAAEKAWSDRWL